MSARSLAPALALVVAACGGSKGVTAPPPSLRPVPVDAGLDVARDATTDDDTTDTDVDVESELACEDVIRDLATYPPALAPDAPERAWNLAVRAHVIGEDCEHLWSYEDKQCIATKGAAACAAQVPGDLTERLTKLGQLGAKIAEAKARPGTIGCKQAVAGHYGPARWHGKLDGFDPKARSQMIADSRALMQKACTSETWSASARACLMLGAADLCLFATPIRHMWGYPADGSVHLLGVPECDDYDTAVSKLAKCTNLDAYTRESLVRMAAALKATIAAAPKEERARRGVSCRAALEPIADLAADAGC